MYGVDIIDIKIIEM